MYSVMIVDDEKAIRESLPQAIDFEQYGFRVCATARNGAEALEKTEKYKPEVIFLDVCMPVMDGMGFLQKLHEMENCPQPYIVMLSGYNEFEYARTAMRYGVKAYLTKPLEEEEIIPILLEIKAELEKNTERQDTEKIRQAVQHLRKMYHDGDGPRELYQEYMIMHCVVIKSDLVQEAYSAVTRCLEEKIPIDKRAFFMSWGSVLSYLISTKVLEDYQHSVTLFARHLQYHLKRQEANCTLLFDEKLFAEREGTFRSDYAAHMYQMMSEVFWKEAQIVQNHGIVPEGLSERRLDQEDVYLAKMKEAILELNEVRTREIYLEIVGEVERIGLNIIFIQEICYRIYYALMDLFPEGEEASEKPELTPLDWRDSSGFICFEQWKSALWEQIAEAFSYMEEWNKLSHSGGVTEQALSYIQRHFSEQITLKDVADKFYINSAYLGRCVQKATGVSYKQYLNHLRIEEAKRLICQTDKKVYEIAEEVGFSESKYFVSKFTAEVGRTPLEYRRIMKKE